jgi:hypothetical protein
LSFFGRQVKLFEVDFFEIFATGHHHRDRIRASTLGFYFILFFSAFEHVKSLLIMGPNDIKN